MATSDSRFKPFKFTSHSRPPPLPPKDLIYLERNNPSISSIDVPPNSPSSPPSMNPPTPPADRLFTRKDKAFAFLKFPKRSPRSPSGSGSGEDSIIVIGNDDLENPPPPEPDSQISTPWNFQHNIHVDEAYIGLPPSWSTSLASAGFTPEEIADIQARRAAGSLAPDFRYLYTERPTSPAVAGFQVATSSAVPILSNPTSRSASLPLAEPVRPPIPKLITSSAFTRRPPPKRKPPLPIEELSQNGHKPNLSSSSTTYQSSDSHQSNQTPSSSYNGQSVTFSSANNSTPHHYPNPSASTSNLSSHGSYSTTEDDGQTPLARVPYLNDTLSHSAPATQTDSGPPVITDANSPSEFGLARKLEEGESEDRPKTADRTIIPKSIWGTKRTIPGKLSSPSLSSLASSAKLPSSSSAVPPYLQHQQTSQLTPPSSSFVAAASSSLSTLKVAAASTSHSIAAAVRNTKGVLRRGLGTSKDNDDSEENVENPEDEESDALEIDAIAGEDGEDALAPAGQSGRKAVWQLYARPRTLTDASSTSLDVNQQEPTNTTNTTERGGKPYQSYLPFSRSQGSLRSLTRQNRTVKKKNSQASLNTQGSVSQTSLNSVSAPASGSGTLGTGDVRFIKNHQNSESIASLESIPEAEGSAGLPSRPYPTASNAAASSSVPPSSVNPAVLPTIRPPHLTLLHQNKASLDLSSWSEALLSGLSKSTELDLGFTFREGEREAAQGRKERNKDGSDGESVTKNEMKMEKGKEKEPGSPSTTARPFGDPTQTMITNWNVPATSAGTTPQPIPTKPRYPAPARQVPPIIVNNNASSSTSILPAEKPPLYPTSRSRSHSHSKTGSPTSSTAPPLPVNGHVIYPHHHHGYGQSPKPPPAVPLPPPPPSAVSNIPTTTNNNNNTTAASATMALRGILSPPPAVAPFTAASILSPPPQSLKSPATNTSPNSAQLWGEIEKLMDPGIMQKMGMTGAGVDMGPGRVVIGPPPGGVKGPVKTAGGAGSQAQDLHLPAAGLEPDAGTSTITTVGDLVGSSPDSSTAQTESFSLFSPKEEKMAATRVLRAGEVVFGTTAHSRGGEKKSVEEGEENLGDSGHADVSGLEEAGEGSEGDQQEIVLHVPIAPDSTDRHLVPDNHVKQRDREALPTRDQVNRDSSRSSSSTLTAEAVAVAATTIVRKVSVARRTGAVVLKGGANVNSALLAPAPASSSNNGIRSRNSPSPPSIVSTQLKHPSSPLSSSFGNSSEESAESLLHSISPSSPSQDNYPTPATDSASLASPLLYYLDGTQTPAEKMAFGPLPPLPTAVAEKPQPSRMKAQNEGSVDSYDYNYSPGGDDDEDSVPFAYPDEATVEAVRASMAPAGTIVPAPRPTIVINDEPRSTAIPTTAATSIGTAGPLSPFQQYRGWLSAIVAPLEEFIDEAVDPRNHYLDLKEIAEGESGSVFSARLNPLTASKLRLPTMIRAKDEEEMSQHPEQVKLVAIKSVAIVPSGSPKLVDLQRELTLMKGLMGHENVLGMDGVYVDLVEDSLWVRMELMERSLADMVGLVADGLMLQDRMLARFASDVLSALEYLQKHSIAHRDVRSDNLLLNKHGFLKLADFSNAVQVTKDSPMRSDLAGVIFWQAPEVRKPPYNVLKVDVWSLGATVWETAQTEPPFYVSQQFGDRWPPLSQPELYSLAFHEFLRKCSEPASSRPSPSDLLKHPFVRNACGRPVIVHLLSQCMAIEQSLQGVDAFP